MLKKKIRKRNEKAEKVSRQKKSEKRDEERIND